MQYCSSEKKALYDATHAHKRLSGVFRGGQSHEIRSWMLHACLSSGNSIFSFPAVTRRVLSHLKEKEID